MPTLSGLSPEESEALEQFYRAEYQRMLRVAGYTLKNDNLAETAVQETFVTAARKIDSLLSSPNPTGWLYNTLNYCFATVITNNSAQSRYSNLLKSHNIHYAKLWIRLWKTRNQQIM